MPDDSLQKCELVHSFGTFLMKTPTPWHRADSTCLPNFARCYELDDSPGVGQTRVFNALHGRIQGAYRLRQSDLFELQIFPQARDVDRRSVSGLISFAHVQSVEGALIPNL